MNNEEMTKRVLLELNNLFKEAEELFERYMSSNGDAHLHEQFVRKDSYMKGVAHMAKEFGLPIGWVMTDDGWKWEIVK